MNQLVVGGRCFLLLPDLSIGTIEAHSLGTYSIQYTYEAKGFGYEHASDGRLLSFPSIASASKILSSHVMNALKN